MESGEANLPVCGNAMLISKVFLLSSGVFGIRSQMLSATSRFLRRCPQSRFGTGLGPPQRMPLVFSDTRLLEEDVFRSGEYHTCYLEELLSKKIESGDHKSLE
jgi:hypothetical protein